MYCVPVIILSCHLMNLIITVILTTEYKPSVNIDPLKLMFAPSHIFYATKQTLTQLLDVHIHKGVWTPQKGESIQSKHDN